MRNTITLTLALVFSMLFAVANCAWAVPITGGTGPGGVGLTDGSSSLELWLRGDGVTGVTSGDPLGVWSDESGNSNDTSGGAPTYETAGGPNGMPVARFNGSQAALNLVANSMTVGTALIVAEYDSATFNNFDGLFNGNTAAGNPDLYFTGNSGSSNWFGTSEFNTRRVNGDSTATVIPTLDQFNFYTGTDTTPLTKVNWVIGIDRANGGRLWEGDIAEVILHDSVLTTPQRVIVENYLNAKYELPFTTATNDYYDGDTALNGDYDLDVFGIGNDNVSPLTMSGSEGMGIDAGGTLDSGEFVLAGHKTTDNGLTSADVPGFLRWERVWYIDTNSDVGNGVDVSLGFGASDSGLAGFVAGSTLFYSPTDPFSFTALATASSTLGDQAFFDISNLQTGYYTVGVPIPEPSSFLLLGLGALGLVRHTRRRRRETFCFQSSIQPRNSNH